VNNTEATKPETMLSLDSDIAAVAVPKANEAGVDVSVYLNALLRTALELPRRPPKKMGSAGGSAG
jgi:hypothetical protein